MLGVARGEWLASLFGASCRRLYRYIVRTPTRFGVPNERTVS